MMIDRYLQADLDKYLDDEYYYGIYLTQKTNTICANSEH